MSIFVEYEAFKKKKKKKKKKTNIFFVEKVPYLEL